MIEININAIICLYYVYLGWDKMSNDNFIKELKKLYNEHNIIPFIGAGLSIPFNIPDWGKLIRDCAINMGIENVNGTSFIQMLDFSLNQYDYWEAVRIIKKYLNRTEEDIQEYIVNTIKSNILKEHSCKEKQ